MQNRLGGHTVCRNALSVKADQPYREFNAQDEADTPGRNRVSRSPQFFHGFYQQKLPPSLSDFFWKVIA